MSALACQTTNKNVALHQPIKYNIAEEQKKKYTYSYIYNREREANFSVHVEQQSQIVSRRTPIHGANINKRASASAKYRSDWILERFCFDFYLSSSQNQSFCGDGGGEIKYVRLITQSQIMRPPH